ncbi:hypothetical protein [Sporosarcina ureae]|uniref:hypothetical protein n=1 Tax=Sporosarcina ureae TaxID=1571 RepID=UPI000A17B3D2|nr:hypothetical protein [Sporosarcina ureae]ARK22258.1 hypothetical protein SporoP32a_12415 [Sporosarcina ureae]
MKFYKQVCTLQVALNVLVPESTIRVGLYYFKRCIFTFMKEHEGGSPTREYEKNLSADITNVLTETVSEGNFTSDGDMLMYSVQPKKLRGYGELEAMESMANWQVEYLLESFSAEPDLLSRLIGMELVIDAIHYADPVKKVTEHRQELEESKC